MPSINKVILVGHLGKDPETRSLPNGDAVTNLRLATSKSWLKDGERVEKTEWHSIVLFGKIAEVAARACQKGTMVYIEGEIATRTWEKDGVTRYTTEIMLPKFGGEFQVLTGRAAKGEANPGQGTTTRAAPAPDLDDDIPF